MEEEASQPPVNENPAGLITAYQTVVLFLQTYGWFVVIGIAVLFYLRHRFSSSIESWQRRRQEQDAWAFDASVASRRHEAMEASRQRLQAQLDAQAEDYKRRQKEKEEEKRKAKIEDWQRHQEGKGYRSKVKTKEEDQPSTSTVSSRRTNTTYRRNDFNPLTGGGGGGNYCPPRRGPSGGG